MGKQPFDGVKFNYGAMLVIIIILFIFGSTELDELQSAP